MGLKQFLSSVYYGRYDKTVHGIISFLLMFVALWFVAWYWALLIVLSIGILKEVYDAYQPNKRFDLNDMAINFLGMAIGYFAWNILH